MTGRQPFAPASSSPSESGTPRRFELPTRFASGGVMGVATVVALIAGGRLAFWVIVAVGAIAALREWHRLINGKRFAREMFITGLTMLAVVWFGRVPGGASAAMLAIVAGAAATAGSAWLRRLPALWPIPWHAFGAVYIGLPVLALVILREDQNGIAVIGGLFVAVWTTDTAALLFGRLIGGPKLAPALSPNKTWAGIIGGTLAAGLAETVYFELIGAALPAGAAFGIFLGIAAHCGDLFESWVKRQFRAKNTGSLIPGHGGMLDRLDSMAFAAPVCALLVSWFPVYGAVS